MKQWQYELSIKKTLYLFFSVIFCNITHGFIFFQKVYAPVTSFLILIPVIISWQTDSTVLR